ncbi:MAG TPA: acyltransferase [Candidatus Methylacidiphilales bacterium]|jgi:peptidoglycan/LPS O-acetylase OafA/YrhL|nr:acyltransferase [Candidatus Methylacidiphilales bacterium]
MGVFRLFLALSVLLGHTRGHGFLGLSFVYPEIAVQSFFIISGFYMALVLNEKYNQPGQYTMFLKQRFLRLYPTYFILITAVVLIDLAVYGMTGRPWGSLKSWHDTMHLLSPTAFVLLVLENLVIFGQDVVMLLRMNPADGTFHFFWHNAAVKPVDGSFFLLIGSSWSLAVEFCFYVLAPFLVRHPVRVQIVIFILCFILRAAIYLMAPQDVAYHWIYCLFPPNLFFFMAGSLGYILYKNHQAQLKAIAVSKPWIIVIFAVLALDYCRFPDTRQLYLIWMPLVFVMVPMLFALTCRNRVDRLIGELSYPCYLIHPHVLMVTIPFFGGSRYEWLLGPVSVAVTLIVCGLFYRFIEMKTERFREGLYKKSKRAALERTPSPADPPEPSSAPTLN